MATAFAVYSADDNSLNFYKRDTVPAAGDSFNGKTATEVYTGIETDVYEIKTNMSSTGNVQTRSTTGAPWYWSNISFNMETYEQSQTDGPAINIRTVRFIDEGIKPISTLNWFYSFSRLTNIEGIDKFNTSSVTNMSNMFQECSALTSLNLNNLNTSSVTNMSNMFKNCSALTSLDISSLNTSRVTNMSSMFDNCKALTSLDVSSFNTANVTNMSRMFYYCSKLTSLDISNFNTSSVTDMSNMFYYCSKLTSLDISSLSTSRVTNMSNMFAGLNLTSLNISSFNTSSVTNMSNMFYYCKNIKHIYVSNNWSTVSVTNSNGMFNNCPNLPNFNSSVVDKSNAHYNSGGYLTKDADFTDYYWCGSGINASDYTCKAVRTVVTNGSVTEQSVYGTITRDSYAANSVTLTATFSDGWAVTTTNTITKSAFAVYSTDDSSLNFYKRIGIASVGETFNGRTTTEVYTGFETDTYSSAQNVPWSINGSTITSVIFIDSEITPISTNYWFCGMEALTKVLNLSNLDTSSVTNMKSMFQSCSKLTSLDISSLNTSSVTNMSSMFYGCSALISLNLNNLNTSSVTNMSYMFQGCSAIKRIYVSDNWSVENVTSSTSMFSSCTNLPNFNKSVVDKTNAFIGEGGYLIDVTTKVTIESGAVDILVNKIATIPSTTETWTFTLSDGSTVTRTVYIQ